MKLSDKVYPDGWETRARSSHSTAKFALSETGEFAALVGRTASYGLWLTKQAQKNGADLTYFIETCLENLIIHADSVGCEARAEMANIESLFAEKKEDGEELPFGNYPRDK